MIICLQQKSRLRVGRTYPDSKHNGIVVILSHYSIDFAYSKISTMPTCIEYFYYMLNKGYKFMIARREKKEPCTSNLYNYYTQCME